MYIIRASFDCNSQQSDDFVPRKHPIKRKLESSTQKHIEKPKGKKSEIGDIFTEILKLHRERVKNWAEFFNVIPKLWIP